MVVIMKPANLQALMLQLEGLSVKHALITLIKRYRRGNMIVNIGTRSMSLQRLLMDSTTWMLSGKCGDFEIRFYGGPPGKARWFNGTLLTLLCDAVLFEEHCTLPFDIACFK